MGIANQIVNPKDLQAKLAASRQGRANKEAGDLFETEIDNALDVYAETKMAYLARMPVPTTPTQIKDPVTGAPLRRLSGMAPFDIYGHWGLVGTPQGYGGRMIGAELKTTGAPATTLPIVAPKMRGTGLQFHQLDALANLAKCGGTAAVIWCNGGEVGVIRNDQVVLALHTYLDGNAQRGTRSIPWDAFTVVPAVVEFGTVYFDWLRVDPLSASRP